MCWSSRWVPGIENDSPSAQMPRNLSWAWWHMLVTPALESLGQEDHHKLGVRLEYIDKILSEEKK